MARVIFQIVSMNDFSVLLKMTTPMINVEIVNTDEYAKADQCNAPVPKNEYRKVSIMADNGFSWIILRSRGLVTPDKGYNTGVTHNAN
jgi:hypothetical protein